MSKVLLIRMMVVIVALSGALKAQLRPTGASELAVALKKLNVLGSALYVGAHPDDENSAVIAALAKGRMVRTAYLSMTRGEGGQNLIGSEQGDLLGVIRTQELLAARRVDGGEQFFTRAIDFGYSKTSEETIRIWGREKIIADIVWTIRSFRPDIIMTRFLDTLGGHGNHTSSAILAREAFLAAGDPTQFPEQLRFVKPWQPKRIVFNIFRFGGTGMEPGKQSVKLDVGEYSPLLGESFSEISGRSRSMHKSQGFGAGQNRGSSLNYFHPTAGESARMDLFDGVDMGWSRVKGGERIGSILSTAATRFNPERPWESIPQLLDALKEMKNAGPDPWIDLKKKELTEVILGCAGVWTDALASDYEAAPGSRIGVTVSALSRSDVSLVLQSIRIAGANLDTLVQQRLVNNTPIQTALSVVLPKNTPYSQPYWLENEPEHGTYVIRDQMLTGKAENPPALTATLSILVGGETVTVDVPVRHRWVDPVKGEQYRPFIVVPAVTVTPASASLVFSDRTPQDIRVIVTSHEEKVKGTVRLDVPRGWKVSPASIPFDFTRKRDEHALTFSVEPLDGAPSGEFVVIAESEGSRFERGMSVVSYPHIPIQAVFPASKGKLVRVDLKRSGQHLGYVMGSGDEVPKALEQIGYEVKLLTDDDLEFGDLGAYDAIVAGVRSYNTRPKLRAHQERVMDYVKNGGRYVVQYVTSQRGETSNMGPYPFNVSRDRVTVEESPVTFVSPGHPVLTMPNRISEKDFFGWVQERGLYFADSWDKQYDAVLECHDPGEPPRRGGLLYAVHGKGVYIFTGYAFFRQLPAGVPGAYRLFVNLISKNK